MSETLSIGIAAGAVSACADVIAAAGYATYRAMLWLSEQEKRELERLEQELAIPMPKYTTTGEAREVFQNNLTIIKAQIVKSPILTRYTDAIARVLALNNSPLHMFVDESYWKELHGSKINVTSFNKILEQASRSFTQANAAYITQSISEAAIKAGFTSQRVNRYDNNVRILVMGDEQGRSLIANVVGSENGAKINMDLTGFGDGSCHAVMDRVLNGLNEKDICLGEIQRRSHYCREGSIGRKSGRSKKKIVQVYPEEERNQSDIQRRQHHHNNTKIKQKL